jgi:hypothetical protein
MSDNCRPACKFVYNEFPSGQVYKCHREVEPGREYCIHHQPGSAGDHTCPGVVGGPAVCDCKPEPEDHGYEPLVQKLVNKLRALPADKKAALVAQLQKVLRNLT